MGHSLGALLVTIAAVRSPEGYHVDRLLAFQPAFRTSLAVDLGTAFMHDLGLANTTAGVVRSPNSFGLKSVAEYFAGASLGSLTTNGYSQIQSAHASAVVEVSRYFEQNYGLWRENLSRTQILVLVSEGDTIVQVQRVGPQFLKDL